MSIPASVPAPIGPGGFQSKGRARAAMNNKRYGTPLPILLPESPLYAAPLASPPPNSSVVRLGLFTSARAIVPSITGKLDRDTQSVWIEDSSDMRLLFERGFFGKGSLSRSEPTWRDGRKELLKGGNAANAEKIREQRRKERKQFKIDRAAAMKEAAVKAEKVLAARKAAEAAGGRPGTPGAGTPGTTGTPGTPGGAGTPKEETELKGEGLEEGEKPETPNEVDTVEGELDPDLDVNALTPQTFLVRPTRPDANRNRGKKAFRRKPAPAAGAAGAAGAPADGSTPGTPAETTETGPTEEELAAQAAEKEEEVRRRAEEKAREAELDEIVSELVEEREHLQLSYVEALFLAGIGVLKIHDPEANALVPRGREIASLLTPLPNVPGTINTEILPDDPLLVQYAVYHHFRALGWCVRSGIKFCVDWLLYRRGPVFSHSAFSILVVPVYMTNADRSTSPFAVTDFYNERQSWKWINTVMRVNSLVMKTVIVVYVTIPSRETFRDYGGDVRRIMGQYTVREVSLMRFSPARRRD